MTRTLISPLLPLHPPTLCLSLPATFADEYIIDITSDSGVQLFLDFHAPQVEEIGRALRPYPTKALIIRVFEPSLQVIEELPRWNKQVAGVYLPAQAISKDLSERLESAGMAPGIMVGERADLIGSPFSKLPLIARSHEAGGFGGPLGTFVLLQVMKKFSHAPFFLEGAQNIAGMAAAVANGAAGVVLGAIAWGFPEINRALAEKVKKVRAHEIIRIANREGRVFSFACNPKPDIATLRTQLSCLPPAEWPAHLPEMAVPAGQDIEFSREQVATFGSLPAFLHETQARLKRPSAILHAPAKVAQELGIRYPIIQGPMARISDKAAFLSAVQKAGAMPVAAFAGLAPEACANLMKACRALECNPGVGVIGLDIQRELVSKQLSQLGNVIPPFVLVAAPYADLIESLLKKGHRPLSHAPHLPLLIELFALGCRWFILEGSESGGHIGRYSSLVLWQLTLAEIKKRGWQKDVRLIFAGGIATKYGVSFIQSLIGQYFPGGDLEWGIQLGTPYIATREAVDTGAITRNYRNWILNEERTRITGETVGLRARQVATPFVTGILEREEEALARGLPLAERRELFEAANVGNLGRATTSREGEDGCFMAGESIALLDRLSSFEDLHRELLGRPEKGRVTAVCEQPASSANPSTADTSEPIAVIGMGCLFPGSRNPAEFFSNILGKRCFIRPMPEHRLDPHLFFHPDPAVPLTTYSRIGAVLDPIDFDPTLFRIPPRIAAAMDECQKLSLICARQALLDAGYLDGPRVLDREKTAVIIGNSMGGPASIENVRAVHSLEFSRHLEQRAEQAGCRELVRRLIDDIRREYPLVDITEDSLPGELGSLIAGRVAAVFDLHGPNFTIDAACGSSLAAVVASVQALRLRSINLALAGGVDMQMDPASFIKFAKVTALSAKGSYPFDHRADGFVMGEGAGIILLKRLEDALRDGDHIYSVILGVGQSSDGKGRGITAPNPEGQRRAIDRAWKDAGRSFQDISYLEAHGTGTRVGDEIELLSAGSLLHPGVPAHEAPMAQKPLDDQSPPEAQAKMVDPKDTTKSAMNSTLSQGTPGNLFPVGSVKANIGHLKAAAGIAGLMKALWAIHQRVIPPQPNFDHFPETWKTTDLPFVVPCHPETFQGSEMLVGVSSFGFGGTNHHIVLGETPRNRVDRVISIPPTIETNISDQGREKPQAPKVAIVFPGQGSQYAGMLAAWRHEPIFADVLRKADQVFQANQPGFGSLMDLIYPSSELLAEPTSRESAENRLQNTLIAQPAILAVSAGMLGMFHRHGLTFDMALGHSLGEYSALLAAEVMSLEQILEMVTIRAHYMSSLPPGDLGTMAVIGLPASEVQLFLHDAGANTASWGYVVVANLNSPKQTVISGETKAVDQVITHFSSRQVMARRLNVSAAFHSNIVAGAVSQYRHKLQSFSYACPKIPVPSNLRGESYPFGQQLADAELKERFIDCSSGR